MVTLTDRRRKVLLKILKKNGFDFKMVDKKDLDKAIHEALDVVSRERLKWAGYLDPGYATARTEKVI
jgi:glycogen synthase